MKNAIILSLLLISFALCSQPYTGPGEVNVRFLVDQLKVLTNLEEKKWDPKEFEEAMVKVKNEVTKLNSEASVDEPSTDINTAAMAIDGYALSLSRVMDNIRKASDDDELKKEIAELEKLQREINAAIDPVDISYLAPERTQAKEYLLAVKRLVLDIFINNATAAAWSKMKPKVTLPPALPAK